MRSLVWLLLQQLQQQDGSAQIWAWGPNPPGPSVWKHFAAEAAKTLPNVLEILTSLETLAVYLHFDPLVGSIGK